MRDDEREVQFLFAGLGPKDILTSPGKICLSVQEVKTSQFYLNFYFSPPIIQDQPRTHNPIYVSLSLGGG